MVILKKITNTNQSGSEYLDEHNVFDSKHTGVHSTGTYAYFATVDENWNSQYPYDVLLHIMDK